MDFVPQLRGRCRLLFLFNIVVVHHLSAPGIITASGVCAPLSSIFHNNGNNAAGTQPENIIQNFRAPGIYGHLFFLITVLKTGIRPEFLPSLHLGGNWLLGEENN